MCLPSLQGPIFQFHSSSFFEAHEAGLALESADSGIQTVFILCCDLTVQVIPKDASGPNKILTHFLNEQQTFFFTVWIFIQLFIPKFISRFFANDFKSNLVIPQTSVKGNKLFVHFHICLKINRDSSTTFKSR